MHEMVDRRNWLKTAGLAAVGAGLGVHCASPLEPNPNGTQLRRVHVSRNRIIRTTVGLRPTRPSGFVLRSETFGDKTIIHNFGHGGSGMSLSWGTAHLAMELALETGASQVAVVGAGVVGLSTARLLQQKGYQVTVYAKDLPPRTTSNMSAAYFGPTGAYRSAYENVWHRATRLSHRYFQDYLGDEYGVRWVPYYLVSQNPPSPQRGLGRLIEDLYPETAQLDPSEHPFPTPYVRRRWTLQFEPSVYLKALLRDVRLASGPRSVIVREFTNLDELLMLDEPVIMNCTGLGAKPLFGDEELHPVKGQLTVLLPQPEVDYAVVGGGLYMLPRRDGIILGSTREANDWTLEPSETEMERVMNGNAEFFDAMT
ncbi:MAG: FAD-dependent oxidoreductase [Vicinamibacterales bacterium]|nr:FAD-dependent oxidoreductase [Acidobacteriota bacterium]MDP7210600.1 FAD-dependent oxidoreductase [Vicinamibacterales bacterium]